MVCVNVSRFISVLRITTTVLLGKAHPKRRIDQLYHAAVSFRLLARKLRGKEKYRIHPTEHDPDEYDEVRPHFT